MDYFIGSFEVDDGRFDTSYVMFGAAGSELVVSAPLFWRIGGFDDDFFLQFEESDLCWRSWLCNKQIIFTPKSIVYHAGQGGSFEGDSEWPSKQAYYFIRNRISSMIKNYEIKNVLIFVPMNILFMLGLSLFDIKKRKIKKSKYIIRAILWNFRYLKKTLKKRGHVQRLRILSDEEIFEQGIIKKFNLKKSIVKSKRMNLF